MSLPVLYSFRRCPYAMRARLAVMVSGLRCELREVILRDKPPALLQASPKGTVPVLVTPQGQVIDESLDIMIWALTQHDPADCLPQTEDQAEQVKALIARNDGPFKQALDRYKYPDRHQQREDFTTAQEYAQRYRQQGAQILHDLNQRLGQTRYLLSDRVCLADLALFPFVRQFAHTDADWFAQQDWAALQGWLQGWLSSELMHSVMDKYPAWTPEAEPVLFGG